MSRYPDYLLFIENKTTFERYCREIDDGGWVFFTHGFPARHWQKLYIDIIQQLPVSLPIYHWGDMDPGGYRILVFMANLLERNVIPYQMLIEKGRGNKAILLDISKKGMPFLRIRAKSNLSN